MPRPTLFRLLATALLPALLLPLACGHDNSPSPADDYNSFDRKGMLQNLGGNVVIPALGEFAGKADSLAANTAALTQGPISAAALGQTQQLWRRTAAAYKRCEPYQFGPLGDPQMLAAQIDFWPIRPANIEALLAGSAPLDEAAIAQQGTAVKGLAALEYTLFSRSDAAGLLARYNAGTPDAARRRAYLVAVAQYLRTEARLAQRTWEASYLPAYVQADGQDITGSINQTVNAVLAFTDVIKNKKVGEAAGKNTGTVNAAAVEAYESDASLDLLLQNLTGIERLFTGTSPVGTPGPGFNAFLDHLGAKYNGQPLSAAIAAQLGGCRAKAQALGTPSLATAVQQNPAGVDALYQSLKQLLVLLKVDMVKELGVTVTFSDADGD